MFGKLVRRSTPAKPAEPVPPPAPAAPAAESAASPEEAAEARARDRLRAFAFAAADMLVETTQGGLITFASGSFNQHYNQPARALIGRNVATLISPGDQPAFAMAQALAPLRGRMAPMVLHLADPGRSPAVVAARAVPGEESRLCFTIGPVPVPAAERGDLVAAIQSPADFAREAEAHMREGGTGPMGLVEVQGWQDVKSHLSATEQQRLRHGLTALMGDCGPDARGSELAEGRFGVLGLAHNGMEGLVRKLEQFLLRSSARSIAKVHGTEMSLEAGPMGAATANRVLRYAVSRFTAEGTAGVNAVGGAGGLTGILAQAELRTQSVRAALAGHRFRLLFQPVVSLANRAVHHYEALLRPIATPGMPLGSIQEFVTFAEAVGLSEVMDLAVMEQALMALRSAPGVSVAVNISGLSLQSPDFAERLFALLAEMRPTPGAAGKPRLLVELTETAEIDNIATAAATWAKLREQGVGLCLDDFGAGAAAFRYLQQFRVDYVKIDGSFVRSAQLGARERAIVQSMVELAVSAGAKTVAEMIETEEQATLMRELGVDQGQGWLFGKPGGLPGAIR